MKNKIIYLLFGVVILGSTFKVINKVLDFFLGNTLNEK